MSNGKIRQGFSLKKYIAEKEIFYIRRALEEAEFSRGKAAKILGLNKSTLSMKMKKYGFPMCLFKSIYQEEK
jgi:transcriptional regulator with PAS, ATPase and Fis domain